MSARDVHEVRVFVLIDGEVAYSALLVSHPKKEGTVVTSLVSPNYNLERLGEMFEILSAEAKNNYYMQRVKYLSKEARDEIKRALGEEDLSDAPF